VVTFTDSGNVWSRPEMNRSEGEKMKISKKRINQAIEALKFVNGRKTERIITVNELKKLIADAEATYKANCKDKYFLGVKALEMGTSRMLTIITLTT
jgi:hypothetical protein